MYSQRIGPKRSDIGQQSSHQHADWYDHYSHCLLSLLTCLPPTSSPPLVAEVQEPSATLPPSALDAAFLSPVPPPDLVMKRLRCQHKGRFSLSHPPHPPHRSTLSLSVSLTGPNTGRALPLPIYFFRLTGRRYHQRKPQRRLRLDHAIRLDHWNRCRPPSAYRVTTGHRSQR